MTISNDANKLGRQLAAEHGDAFVEGLNAALNQFFGKAFVSAPSAIASPEGDRSESLAVAIRVLGSDASKGLVASESCAVVIDVVDVLDDVALEISYRRISAAKALTRGPSQGDEFVHSTLGIIYARRASVPMDNIATRLQTLNSSVPSTQWPDRIIVDSVGTIEYGVQFPGDTKIGGWLPPTKETLRTSVPAVYVIMAMMPTGARTFSKMLSYVAAHLFAFTREPDIPAHVEFLEGIEGVAIPIASYQYDLGGNLQRVPVEMQRSRLIPLLPLEIEDQRGGVLATVNFLPWQDGGVVIMEGKFPLEGLLLLGDEAFRNAGILRPRTGAQISYVMPVDAEQFGNLLDQFQARSNLQIRRGHHKWTVQKVADEGTSSPFVARLMLGVLRMRDMAYFDTSLEEFDRKYEVISTALLGAREAMRTIESEWIQHAAKIRSREIWDRDGQILHIHESADRLLQREAENFLNSATRGLKLGLQSLVEFIGLDIRFLFMKQGSFEAGLARLVTIDANLAAYLREMRLWSERLINARNAIEHVGWRLPPVTYRDEPSGLLAVEPTVLGQPVTQFNQHIFDRLCCSVEDVLAHALSARLPKGMALTEVSLDDRTPESPERFALSLAVGGRVPWRLTYNERTFEQR